jgi:hypothetical protein
MAQKTSVWVPMGSIGFSSGTWARALTANIENWGRTAADAAPIVFCTIPMPPALPAAREVEVESIDLFYEIATAALDAAPTVVVRAVTAAAATIPTLVTQTETEAVTGDDTTGTAVGQYRHRTTITTPYRAAGNDDRLQYECTIDCAATTVLRVYGIRANYNA